MAIQMAETQLYSLEVWAHTLDLGTMTPTEMPIIGSDSTRDMTTRSSDSGLRVVFQSFVW